MTQGAFREETWDDVCTLCVLVKDAPLQEVNEFFHSLRVKTDLSHLIYAITALSQVVNDIGPDVEREKNYRYVADHLPRVSEQLYDRIFPNRPGHFQRTLLTAGNVVPYGSNEKPFSRNYLARVCTAFTALSTDATHNLKAALPAVRAEINSRPQYIGALAQGDLVQANAFLKLQSVLGRRF